MKAKDLTGRRFGRLKVVGPAGSDNNHNKLWFCQCDCGRETIVLGHNLKGGRTKSCGCFRIEIANSVIRKMRIHQARMSKRVKNFKRGAA